MVVANCPDNHTGRPVGQTVINAVSWEFFRPCSSQYKVALQTCIDDLDDDVFVGETDNQTVFGCIAEMGLDEKAQQQTNAYYLFLAWVTSRLRA